MPRVIVQMAKNEHVMVTEKRSTNKKATWIPSSRFF